MLQLDEPPLYRRKTTPPAEYTPEEERNLRMLARALVATARQLLEEGAANQLNGLETKTVQVSDLAAKTGQRPK